MQRAGLRSPAARAFGLSGKKDSSLDAKTDEADSVGPAAGEAWKQTCRGGERKSSLAERAALARAWRAEPSAGGEP
jgi:hypothetical protein